MIIIPTEKRFDWSYRPIVLFSIVFINSFVFFIFQANDNQKLDEAYATYQHQQFFAIEWPLFKEYLTEKQQHSTLEAMEALHQQERQDELIFQMIIRRDFYRYLRIDRYEYFQLSDKADDWFTVREQINTTVQSTIMVCFGLIPDNLSLFNFLSHQFLHGDIMHLLGNLFFLVICGFAVEAALGHWRFLGLYLLAGITGGALHTAFNLTEAIPLVGASGAISGTMAMYLGLFRSVQSVGMLFLEFDSQ